jgi:hypothetical protein
MSAIGSALLPKLDSQARAALSTLGSTAEGPEMPGSVTYRVARPSSTGPWGHKFVIDFRAFLAENGEKGDQFGTGMVSLVSVRNRRPITSTEEMHMNSQSRITGQVTGYCTYDLTWQKQS